MKKFLIFLVAIVVCVCVGVTTFYFLRNDEIISLEKTAIQINVDDYIRKDGTDYKSLGLKVAQKDRRTKYGYRIESTTGEDITDKNVFIYDEDNDVFRPTKGGEYILVITTSNKKFSEFKVNVTVGDGLTATTPYFIRNRDQFNNINTHLNWHYSMLDDIKLVAGDKINGSFIGSFNGNGNIITGLNLTQGTNAGLFESVSGTIKNLVIENAKINGSFTNAGVLAGTISGAASISGVEVVGATITNSNTSSSSSTGGLIGTASVGSRVMLSSVTGTINIGSSADKAVQPVEVVDNSPNVGGLIGKLSLASVKASYAQTTINSNVSIDYNNVGGFIGCLVVDPATTSDFTPTKGIVHQCYSVVSSEVTNISAFIGSVIGNTKIVTADLTNINDSSVANRTYTYGYLIGNYALHANGTDSTPLVGSYNENAKAINDVANKPDACTVSKIGATGATEEEYIYFGSTKWSTVIWDFTTNPSGYPSLKLNSGINESNLQSAGNSYIATSVKVSVSNISNLKIEDNINLEISDDVSEIIKWDLTSETPKNVKHFILNGKGKLEITVKNSLVNKLTENSEIKGVKIIVASVDTSAEIYGGLANEIINSQTTDVVVEYAPDCVINNSTIKTFGGVVGSSNDGTITNCSATGINIQSSVVNKMGGIVGISDAASKVVLGNNNVSLTFNSSDSVKLGGVAAESDGTISGDKAEINIDMNIANAVNNSSIAGIVSSNKGTLSNIKMVGNGIKYNSNMTANTLSIAGVVVDNSAEGKINNVYNYMTSIGGGDNANEYNANKNFNVAGLVWFNEGNISQCIMSTNLYGNVVAGVVGTQGVLSEDKYSGIGNANSSIKEVLVAGANWDANKDYNANNAKFEDGAVIISGNKFVAGIAYTIANGVVEDVQTNSIINAGNDAKASLIVLYFPNGASLKNSVINSMFTGSTNAIYYRDTYSDLDVGNEGYHYNLYGNQGFSGTMTSVVVNQATAFADTNLNLKDSKDSRKSPTDNYNGNYLQSKFIGTRRFIFGYGITYNTEGNQNNYVRDIESMEDFANSNYFKGQFDLISHSANTFQFNGNTLVARKDLTFAIGGTWTAKAEGEVGNFGITLSFVKALNK